MADEAVLRVLLEGSGGSSPESPAGARLPSTPPERPPQTRPEPAGRRAGRAESPLTSLIDLFSKLRGTLGGFLGPVVGAALDAAKAIRDMQLAASNTALRLQHLEKPSTSEAARIAAQFEAPAPAAPFAPKAVPAPAAPTEKIPAAPLPAQEEIPEHAPSAAPAPTVAPKRVPRRRQRESDLQRAALEQTQGHKLKGPRLPPAGKIDVSRPLGLEALPPGPNIPAGPVGGALPAEHVPGAPSAAGVFGPPRVDAVEPPPRPPSSELQAAPTVQEVSASPQIPATMAMEEPAAMGAVGETMAGGMAAMAGPAGIALAVVQALKMVQGAAHDLAAGMGKEAAKFMSAKADPAEFVQTLGQGISQVSDKLFWISPALGIFGSVVGGAAESLGALMHAFDAMADRYAAYSPQLAIAQARAEVAQVLGDIRRAREIGPELAAFTKTESQLQQQIEDEKIKLMRAIMPLVIDGMKILILSMPLITGGIEQLDMFLRPITFILEKILGKIPEPKDDWTLPTSDVLYGSPFRFRPGQ